ncbi:MAG TPA: hemerythrin domain-containing protein [Myxococcota bacterium]|nr:hemerythrin domain-containing protein [Myxococcota bacterium]
MQAGPGLRHRLERALRQIAQQHRQLHELGAGLLAALAAGDRGAVRRGFLRYLEAVGAHFALEDGVFFPALHGLHPERSGELEPIGAEHAGLLDALRRLGERLGPEATAAFAEGFESLRAALAAHERREEQVVSRLTAAPPAPGAGSR